ncbi:MAG: PHP domain-containing protein [Nocardioidaceae bacterium]
MRIDLHTHSDRSDGTDAPGELIGRAVVTGVDVVALTDHDTAVGWDDARAAATEVGVGFVPGIEISCKYGGIASGSGSTVGVHLLGYLADPEYPPLADELARVLEGRSARLPATLERLRGLGIDITTDDVRAVSGPAEATGRPHVADALVAKGVVGSRDEAFDRFLASGRPAYVDRYAADLIETIGLVRAAGGVSVVAHPWGRHSRTALDADDLAELKRAGLTGVEVDHPDHDQATRNELRELAARLGLLITGSSDFHGDGKPDCPLGANTTDPEQFEALLAAAAASSTLSRRATPAPVLP